MNLSLLGSALPAILTVLFWVSLGMSQSADRWNEDVVLTEVELSVFPARLVPDSLGYTLYDPSTPKGDYNAASYYYRAALKWASLPKTHRQQLFERREAWLEGSLADLPRDEIEKWLSETSDVLAELDQALAGECDWGFDSNGMTYSELQALDLSVELTVFRELGNVLQLAARLHLSQSEFDKGVNRLADCITLSQDLMKLPRLPWMSHNIIHATLRTVNQMGSLPDSPNMLRALQALPKPVINYRPAIKRENLAIGRSFAFLDDPENSIRTEAQWRALFLDCLEQFDRSFFQNWKSSIPESKWDELVASRERRLGLLIAGVYPSAKQELLKAGWDKERLDRMPVGQVIAIQTTRVWEQYNLMFHGLGNLSAAEARKRSQQMQSSDLFFAYTSFPIGWFVTCQDNLLLSRCQELEISMNVELLRDWLATNDSFPSPEQFSEMSSFPDPESDKSFEYRLLSNGDCQIQSSVRTGRGGNYIFNRFTLKKK